MTLTCRCLTLAMLLAGCSDDGSPLNAGGTDGDAGDSGSPTSDGTTGSITTTATASATSGPAGSGSDGESEGDSSGPADPTDDAATSGTTSDDGETFDGTSGTGGVPEIEPCRTADDCLLVNDCCACAAASVDAPIDRCPQPCRAPACDAYGLADAQVTCEKGVCVFVEYSCSIYAAVCDETPPECPRGLVPVLEDGCWADSCVPPEVCDYVPACEDCPADWACVVWAMENGPLYSCEPVPEACEGTAACECMPGACGEAPFLCGDDGQGNLGCYCPTC